MPPACICLIIVFFVAICKANPLLQIKISEADTIQSKGYAKGLKTRSFNLKDKSFSYIHNDLKTKPKKGLKKHAKRARTLSFIIGDEEFSPTPDLQDKILKILSINSSELCYKSENKVPTCFQLEKFLSDGPFFNPNIDYSKQFELIDNVDSIANFSSVFLMNPENGNLIHATFHIANQICLSKIGIGKTVFHTLENGKYFYSSDKKNRNLAYMRLKK